jgi:hypothetical protein
MPNNKWDDEHIENLLRDFPKIKDYRAKEEVQSRLEKKQPVQSQPKRWLPYLVAVLAFITISFLVASILDQNSRDGALFGAVSEESAESTAASDSEGGAQPEEESEGEGGSAESANSFTIENQEAGRTAVYESDKKGFTPFSIGLTENALVIPVTFLIPDQQIAEDFPGKTPTSVDLYNKYASEIDEQAIGFTDYHPYLGTLSMEGDTVKHVLPSGHQYDQASASIEVYIASLKETFKDAKRIRVENEDGSPVEFSQVGPLEPIDVQEGNLVYYAHTTESGETYLVPGHGMPEASASEAIQALKTSPSDLHQGTIPEDSEITVTESGDLVTVDFTTEFDLEALDGPSADRLLDSLALTAKSFGKKVQLNNTKQGEWAGFDLSEPLPEPIAPNEAQWKSK